RRRGGGPVAEGDRDSEEPHFPTGREGQLLADGRDWSVRSVLGDSLRSGRGGGRSRARARGISERCGWTLRRNLEPGVYAVRPRSFGKADTAAAALDRYRHGAGANRCGDAG